MQFDSFGDFCLKTNLLVDATIIVAIISIATILCNYATVLGL